MTLCISDNNQRTLINYGFAYSLFTIFLVLLGAIYELFSHEVYSFYMIYAFAIPLVLGVFPALWLLRLKKQAPGRIEMHMWNSGVVTLSVGSVFKGVLEIYGTTNKLIIVYLITGIFFIGVGLLLMFFRKRR